jgi:hypothetical protein
MISDHSKLFNTYTNHLTNAVAFFHHKSFDDIKNLNHVSLFHEPPESDGTSFAFVQYELQLLQSWVEKGEEVLHAHVSVYLDSAVLGADMYFQSNADLEIGNYVLFEEGIPRVISKKLVNVMQL